MKIICFLLFVFLLSYCPCLALPILSKSLHFSPLLRNRIIPVHYSSLRFSLSGAYSRIHRTNYFSEICLTPPCPNCASASVHFIPALSLLTAPVLNKSHLALPLRPFHVTQRHYTPASLVIFIPLLPYRAGPYLFDSKRSYAALLVLTLVNTAQIPVAMLPEFVLSRPSASLPTYPILRFLISPHLSESVHSCPALLVLTLAPPHKYFLIEKFVYLPLLIESIRFGSIHALSVPFCLTEPVPNGSCRVSRLPCWCYF